MATLDTRRYLVWTLLEQVLFVFLKKKSAIVF